MPLTKGVPKSYAEVGGRRILDWIVEALAGFEIVFVGGYRIERVRADYPTFSFRHNARWESNNILASLFHAEDAMADGFVCTYADVLYRRSVVERLMQSPADVTLAVDVDWRARYSGRTQHPEDDAEKVVVDGERVLRVARQVPSNEAFGEYIGLARFTAAGAGQLREAYNRERLDQRAYLIHLIDRMIQTGVDVRKVETAGDYFEVDTTEDYHLAQAHWR